MSAAGSARWYHLCERLGRSTPPPTYFYAATPLAVRLRVDVDMADAGMTTVLHAGQKRSREDAETEDEGVARGMRYEKKARPTSGEGGSSWQRDSVISTPSQRSHPPANYDSDDQSSMMSEPGSPQDVEMSSSDDEMQDSSDSNGRPTFSQSPETKRPSFASSSSPWHHHRNLQNQGQRVPTPSLPQQNPQRPGIRPIQLRTTNFPAHSHHVRGRHPQENISSTSDPAGPGQGHLEVPSPIDEDKVPTPPSAAEAAGSQLSMLSVNDMDIEPPPDSGLPTISVDDRHADAGVEGSASLDSAIDVDSMEDSSGSATPGGRPGLTVRKLRQRSGAVSSGAGGAECGASAKRGFSMGFRADCEKCRLRVPGHMNHFVTS